MTRAFEEAFVGYTQHPAAILQKSFDETEGYEEMIVLRGLSFESHCEHHMAPILGSAWVAYMPNGRVVGISKLARVIEAFAKRLQIQEKLTAQIANTIDNVLKPRGVVSSFGLRTIAWPHAAYISPTRIRSPVAC